MILSERQNRKIIIWKVFLIIIFFITTKTYFKFKLNTKKLSRPYNTIGDLFLWHKLIVLTFLPDAVTSVRNLAMIPKHDVQSCQSFRPWPWLSYDCLWFAQPQYKSLRVFAIKFNRNCIAIGIWNRDVNLTWHYNHAGSVSVIILPFAHSLLNVL